MDLEYADCSRIETSSYYFFSTGYFRRLLRFTAWIAVAIGHSRHPSCKTLQTFAEKSLNVLKKQYLLISNACVIIRDKFVLFATVRF
jgi:hypothetical protein